MTMANSSSINEVFEEAGVEIVAVDAEFIEPAAEAKETEETNDDIAAADNPLNKRLIMLCEVGTGYWCSSSSFVCR